MVFTNQTTVIIIHRWALLGVKDGKNLMEKRGIVRAVSFIPCLSSASIVHSLYFLNVNKRKLNPPVSRWGDEGPELSLPNTNSGRERTAERVLCVSYSV